MDKGYKSPILFIIGGLLTVIFAFNNCGQGFESLSSNGLSVSILNSGQKLNVVQTYPDGTYETRSASYEVFEGQVYVDGMNVGSSEVLKPGDTFYRTTPSDQDSRVKQDFVVEGLNYTRNAQTGVRNAAKSFFASDAVWNDIRAGISQNRVLYIDDDSDSIRTIRTYIQKFNREMNDYNIDFQVAENRSGRYPKLIFKDATTSDRFKISRLQGVGYFASSTLFQSRYPGVSINLVKNTNGQYLTYHDFAQSVMAVLGFAPEHYRVGANRFIGFNRDRALTVTVDGVTDHIKRYDNLSKSDNFNSSIPIDFDSVMLDSSARFNSLGPNFSSQPVIYNKATGEPLPEKDKLSEGDLDELTSLFGPKQPSDVLSQGKVSIDSQEMLMSKSDIDDRYNLSDDELDELSFDKSLFNLERSEDNHNLQILRVSLCTQKSLISGTNPPAVKLARYWDKSDGTKEIRRFDPSGSATKLNNVAKPCLHTDYKNNSGYQLVYYFFKAPLTNGAPVNLLNESVDANKDDKYFIELAESGFVAGTPENPFFSRVSFRGVQYSFNTYKFMKKYNSFNNYLSLNTSGRLDIYNLNSSQRFMARMVYNLPLSPESTRSANALIRCELSSTQLNSMLSGVSDVDSANIAVRLNDEHIARSLAYDKRHYAISKYFSGNCTDEQRAVVRHKLLEALGQSVGPTPEDNSSGPVIVNNGDGQITIGGTSFPICDGSETNIDPQGFAWQQNIGKTCVIECSDKYMDVKGSEGCNESEPEDETPPENNDSSCPGIQIASVSVQSATSGIVSWTLTGDRSALNEVKVIFKDGNSKRELTQPTVVQTYIQYTHGPKKTDRVQLKAVCENGEAWSANFEMAAASSVALIPDNPGDNTTPGDNNSGAETLNQGARSWPVCDGSEINEDSNGFAWMDNVRKTCIVRCNAKYKEIKNNPNHCNSNNNDGSSGDKPICQDPNSDSDGDGWGYENDQSCIMPTNPGGTGGSGNDVVVYAEKDRNNCDELRSVTHVVYDGNKLEVNRAESNDYWIQFKEQASDGKYGVACK